MATITVRNLDDRLKVKLRLRAVRHGRSMEEEVRDILRTALGASAGDSPRTLGEAIRQHFGAIGSVELPEISRKTVRDPPDLGR